jgi:hypothetical protein
MFQLRSINKVSQNINWGHNTFHDNYENYDNVKEAMQCVIGSGGLKKTLSRMSLGSGISQI